VASNESLYGAHSDQYKVVASLADGWIDFGLTALASPTADLAAPCAELNNHLTLRTLVADYRINIADLYLWGCLKRNVNWSKFVESEGKQLPHLLRWFNYLAGLPAFAEFAAKKVEEKEKQKSLAGSTFNYDSLELPGASMGTVVTRFPPEPSGYLHIGHVKAALLNNFYATHYKGKLIIRFDDTNPSKEKDEFVQSILQDLAVLGLSTKVITYTSDYFDKIAEFAIQLIKAGLAYVDNLSKEIVSAQRCLLLTTCKIRKNRFDGIPSPNRENSVEENLRLFKEMVDGTEEGVKCVLRGKIDMQNANKVLRDPALFRCNDTPHHRTGYVLTLD
jgi:hypothetical protein